MNNQSWLGKQLRVGIRYIESLIRKSEQSYEFCNDPDCVLRIQLMPSPRQVTLGEILIKKDDPVLVIHVWNERMPAIPSGGADLKWALHLRRQLLNSFKLLAREMQGDASYAPVRALYGASALFSSTNHTGGMRMMQSFGFTILPYHSSLGKFGEFWENLFSWWLMYAYNSASMESRKFWQLERTEIWMECNDFIRRYGEQVSSET
jgi:hypothetical protein